MVESDLTFIGHGNGHLVSHILQANDIVIKINADTCLIKSRGYVRKGLDHDDQWIQQDEKADDDSEFKHADESKESPHYIE